MNEDDLVGYHGNSIRTYQDWECTEMMEDILRDDELSNMSDDDKTLLENYAPNLFNTATYNEKTVRGMMKELCGRVAQHRRGVGGFKLVNKKPSIYKNSSDEEIKVALRNHAQAILKIVGNPEKGEFDYLTENYHFFKDLMRMVESPEDFMSMDIKYKPASKTKIKKFLHSLKLPNKTDSIEEFVNKL